MSDEAGSTLDLPKQLHTGATSLAARCEVRDRSEPDMNVADDPLLQMLRDSSVVSVVGDRRTHS